MTEKEKIVSFPMYPYDVHIIITDNIGESRAKRNDILGNMKSDDANDCDAMHSYSDKPVSYLFLPPNPSAGLITHEVWHCVRRVMEWIEAELENEVVAYHLGYLVDEITGFIKKKK